MNVIKFVLVLFYSLPFSKIHFLQKPPNYVKLKTNKPVGNVRIVEMNLSSLTPCECDPKKDNPCAPDSDCLNRFVFWCTVSCICINYNFLLVSDETQGDRGEVGQVSSFTTNQARLRINQFLNYCLVVF